MASTFLQLVQKACDEIGISEPSTVVSGADDTSRQLLALSNREGKQFSQLANKSGGWQKLHKEYTFTTQGVGSITGNTTIGSAVISGMNTVAGIVVGMVATGNGISYGPQVTVLSIGILTVTLSANITETQTAGSFTFGVDNYALPSDFEYFIQKTFWDGSYRWQLLGPLEAQEKQILRYGISPVGPRRRFWIRNNLFYLNPVPTNNTDIMAYDYFSNAWCLGGDGMTYQSSWASDSDTYLLDEDCFVMGLKWRFLASKGLNYTQEKQDYEEECTRILGRDGAERDLPLNAQSLSSINLLSDANIPDTNFGQ